jgi:hypothetical protein
MIPARSIVEHRDLHGRVLIALEDREEDAPMARQNRRNRWSVSFRDGSGVVSGAGVPPRPGTRQQAAGLVVGREDDRVVVAPARAAGKPSKRQIVAGGLAGEWNPLELLAVEEADRTAVGREERAAAVLTPRAAARRADRSAAASTDRRSRSAGAVDEVAARRARSRGCDRCPGCRATGRWRHDAKPAGLERRPTASFATVHDAPRRSAATAAQASAAVTGPTRRPPAPRAAASPCAARASAVCIAPALGSVSRIRIERALHHLDELARQLGTQILQRANGGLRVRALTSPSDVPVTGNAPVARKNSSTPTL